MREWRGPARIGRPHARRQRAAALAHFSPEAMLFQDVLFSRNDTNYAKVAARLTCCYSLLIEKGELFLKFYLLINDMSYLILLTMYLIYGRNFYLPLAERRIT